MRIASFDIGKKNFAFCVEDVDDTCISECTKYYNKIPKKFQRYVKGPMTHHTEELLTKLYNGATCVEGGVGVFDIREDKTSNTLDTQTRLNMHNLLESYLWLWDTCDVILIEQQYFNVGRGSKREANVDAIKLGECCLNWFLFKYYTFKEIIIFGSMYKTQMLGAPYKQTKPQRKKWAIEKGVEILTLRGEDNIIDLIDNKKNSQGRKQKQDDVYDCLLMIQAYKYKLVCGK